MALKQEIREYLQATEIPVAEPVHGEISLSACVFPFKQFLFMYVDERTCMTIHADFARLSAFFVALLRLHVRNLIEHIINFLSRLFQYMLLVSTRMCLYTIISDSRNSILLYGNIRAELRKSSCDKEFIEKTISTNLI